MFAKASFVAIILLSFSIFWLVAVPLVGSPAGDVPMDAVATDNVAKDSVSEGPTDDVIAPKGEYAKIDVQLVNDAIAFLKEGTPEEKEIVIKAIEAKPEKFAPVVFCIMSEVLFDQDKKDDAAFWYYAGDLRSRFDAARCADVSARSGIGVIEEQYGPRIDRYCAQDPKKWKSIIEKVVEWDRKTPYEYDHRWINLHGMQAVMASMDMGSEPKKVVEMSLPKEQWKKIAEEIREKYLKECCSAK